MVNGVSSAAESLKLRVVEEARRLGFDAVRIARADVPLDADFARYEAFVDAGMHGEMGWLAEAREVRRRVDTPDVLEGAKSVICLARRYVRSEEDERNDPETARSIARYARGRDYHNGLRKKLRKLAAFVRRLDSGTNDVVHARPLCDDAPVLERAWAARAGLGFVGKNGLLIVPGVGSMVLLGEVVTTLALPSDSAIPERCGTCTRCLDACPTDAFPEPFVLDARRCISYLTIEHRASIDPELRAGMGEHLFGCDDCQLVCPFNAGVRSSRTRRPREGAHEAPVELDARFLPDPRWETTSLADLVGLADDEAFRAVREGSPIGRATREGLARNAAIVLGNRGRAGDDAILEAIARTHDSELVRSSAAWALDRWREVRQKEREGDAAKASEGCGPAMASDDATSRGASTEELAEPSADR